MTESYRTVEDEAIARFTVQGSEFIGHVRPVDSVNAAEEFLAEIRAEYDDATHHVPAYRVREGKEAEGVFLREYQSDDGEPSTSAGKPALNVLVKRDLENVAVVVTRYYGGTNLGVGGLVRAYSRAVSEAIEAAGVREQRPHDRLTVTTAYDDSGTVRGIVESEGYAFEAAYAESVAFEVRVPVTEREAFCDRLRSATGGRVEIESATHG